MSAVVQQLAQQSGAQVVGVDSSWVTDGPSFGSDHLLAVQRELAFKDDKTTAKDSKDGKKQPTVAGQLLKTKAELISIAVDSEESPDYVAGVLANVEVDQEHWLTAGVNPTLVTMVVGNDIYTPIKLSSGKNLAWF